MDIKRDMKMIIDGEFVDAADGAVIENYNPCTRQLIGTVPSATESDVDAAIAAAVAGQEEWFALPLFQRMDIMNNFVSLMEMRQEELAQVTSAEAGKVISTARTEIKGAIETFRAYIAAAHTFCGRVFPVDSAPRVQGDLVITIHEPLGVVVGICPYNFPVSLAAHKIAPALCGGNSIICKPASETPMGTILMAGMLVEAGVPKKAVSCLTGSGRMIGTKLASSTDIAAISFTGSTEAGMDLQRNSCVNLKHMHLELGGNDPMIVFPDCDVELAVEKAVDGRIRHSGQVCTASKRFIVHNSIKEEFISKLCERLSRIRVGTTDDPKAEFSVLVSEQAAQTVEEQVAHTVSQGAKCIMGGKREGAFMEITVLDEVTPEMDIAKDMEVFGPVFPIIGFESYEEAIAIANNTIYGLSSGVITDDIQTAIRAARDIKSGTCCLNGSGTKRSVYAPFGGYKMSGIGREGAIDTLQEYMQSKVIIFTGVMK